MLQPIKHILKQKRIILASGSPRRKELVENIVNMNFDNQTNACIKIGLKVELCPSLFEEDLNPKNFDSFSAFVEETALQKVLEVESRLASQGSAPDMVIGADTMVTLDGEMFGKPQNDEEAFSMLSRLSGRKHTVFTGVVVKTTDGTVKFTEKTDVYFGKLDPEQIRGYIDSREPMDKAGGYGIQGVGGTFVEKVDGDYFTVVGLPLYRLCSVIYDMYKEKIYS